MHGGLTPFKIQRIVRHIVMNTIPRSMQQHHMLCMPQQDDSKVVCRLYSGAFFFVNHELENLLCPGPQVTGAHGRSVRQVFHFPETVDLQRADERDGHIYHAVGHSAGQESYC